MKVLAIGSITKPLTPEQATPIMAKEVPDTLQLYLDGKIDQFWHRRDRQGVIFLINAESVDEAGATLAKLPLVEGGFLTFDYIPVGPLAPLALLTQPKQVPALLVTLL
jgi:muconolactone delta-isomerase